MTANQSRLKNLFERGLDGSEADYRQFLTELAMLLRAYVRRQLARLGRRESEAEDIVQEALLAIHAKRRAYDREVPVAAWAYAIARYKMIDFLRASENTVQALSLDDIEDTVGTETQQVETILAVRRAMATLPERMRWPIELMKLNGLTVTETAVLTGLSEATVKVNVHRGMKAMARLLA